MKVVAYILAVMLAVWGGFLLFAAVGWPGWSA
ncbi:hypothetical protein JOF56_005032 [Kibdelosporangium banguiense]|uniref:Uncharacterized protein n=1 Tax=Kibdelosporangium banguiense TaxID=1365924 RepID=A0ABS4TJQ3_9PSEU|nr:hypothetical protein [Kibdelosporangium banguiense]